MKVLTKQEEQEHYNATLKGGIGGALAGLTVGSLGVYVASTRFHAFRSLTIPFRAFLVTGCTTFSAIISADTYSRKFEENRNPEKKYKDEQATLQSDIRSQKPFAERAQAWASENRYSLVFGSWVASMVVAFGLVSRNKFLSGQQKLVQARVYAQGLTIAVVIASLALETGDRSAGVGRWETVKVLDPNDPSHKHMIDKKIHHERYSGEDQWMDMVEAEERRIKEREDAVRSQEAKDKKAGKKVHKHGDEEHGEVKKSSVRAP